jgi:hypothetical protein
MHILVFLTLLFAAHNVHSAPVPPPEGDRLIITDSNELSKVSEKEWLQMLGGDKDFMDITSHAKDYSESIHMTGPLKEPKGTFY